jgi:hypothetical protein
LLQIKKRRVTFVFLALKSIYMKYKLLFILLYSFPIVKADTDLDMKISAIKLQRENLNQTVSIALIKWTACKEKNKKLNR